MRLPNTALMAVTAGLAFNGMPANTEAQAAQPFDNPEIAALDSQAQQTLARLGNRVLQLKDTASRNPHVRDAEVHTIEPGVREVEIDYVAKKPNRRASLGAYTITAVFETKNKKLSAKDTIGVSVQANAKRNGPSATLDFNETIDRGHTFAGTYEYKKKHYKERIAAATQPTPGEQQLSKSNITAVANQVTSIMNASAKGSPITKQFKPPFIKARIAPTSPIESPNRPPQTQPEPVPANPAIPAPPAEQSPTPPSPDAPEPTPESPLYPETPGQNPWKAGDIGYDVSWANCGQSYPLDAKFVIIGINNGMNFSKNPCLQEQVNAFSYTRENFYLNTGWYDQSTYIDPTICLPGDKICQAYNYGKDAATYSWNAAKAAGLSNDQLKVTWMLDVEPESGPSSNTWSTNVLENRKSLEGQHDRLLELGAANVIEYNTTDSHNEHFGADYKQGWPSVGATTWSTAQEAMEYCIGHEFTGGPSWAMQYDPNVIDKNVACPTRAISSSYRTQNTKHFVESSNSMSTK